MATREGGVPPLRMNSSPTDNNEMLSGTAGTFCRNVKAVQQLLRSKSRVRQTHGRCYMKGNL